MNRVIHSVRAEFTRWLEAECGTWRAWVMAFCLFVLPALAILFRWMLG